MDAAYEDFTVEYILVGQSAFQPLRHHISSRHIYILDDERQVANETALIFAKQAPEATDRTVPTFRLPDLGVAFTSIPFHEEYHTTLLIGFENIYNDNATAAQQYMEDSTSGLNADSDDKL